MSVPPSLDDTQPGKPLQDAPLSNESPRERRRIDGYDGAHTPENAAVLAGGRSLYGSEYYSARAEEPARGMSGCMTLAILAFVALIGVVIVALAGLAGWTSGQRQASISATATQNAAIQAQLERIPGDVAARNPELLAARIEFLATLTPGVPQVPALWTTATALSGSLVTPTPDVTATSMPASETPLPPTNAPLPTNNGNTAGSAPSTTPQAGAAAPLGMNLDLNALLVEAQGYLATAQWEDAIVTLDVIVAVDPTFQTANVRAMMIDALSNRALQLYNGGQPAAGNVIASRIEEFGALPGDVSYERYAAQLILNARAAVGVNYPQAISALRAVMDLGAGGRYYAESERLLYEQYIAYGDAFTYENNWCSAAQQYQSAIGVFSSGAANGKYANANTLCQNPPTLDPLAPVGTLPAGFVPLGS